MDCIIGGEKWLVSSKILSRIVNVYYFMKELVTMGASFKAVLMLHIKERRFNFKIFRNLIAKTVNSIINYNQT